MRSGEAHATHSVDLSNGGEQFGEGLLCLRIFVGVHVLAEQLDVGVASVSHTLGFVKHAVTGATSFFATRVRHYAVGAKLIATFDDGDVPAMWIAARGKLGFEG